MLGSITTHRKRVYFQVIVIEGWDEMGMPKLGEIKVERTDRPTAMRDQASLEAVGIRCTIREWWK